jgi:hypothetical protein
MCRPSGLIGVAVALLTSACVQGQQSQLISLRRRPERLHLQGSSSSGHCLLGKLGGQLVYYWPYGPQGAIKQGVVRAQITGSER